LNTVIDLNELMIEFYQVNIMEVIL